MSDVAMDIADLCFNLSGLPSLAQVGLAERIGTFVRAQAPPDNAIQVRWRQVAAVPAPTGRLAFDPGQIWRMFGAPDGWEAEIRYSEAEPRALMRIDDNWTTVEMLEVLDERASSLLGIGAGELLLRGALTRRGGLVLHSSGLDDHGRGVVFVGHSGAGKSTQLEIWQDEPGVIAMNDDRVALRRWETGWRCYGTPWGGTSDIAFNHAAPLSALIVLEQAPENEIAPLTPAVAAPLLLARSFVPYWDGTLVRAMTAQLQRLVHEVPIYRLRCRPERAVIDLVRSVLR